MPPTRPKLRLPHPPMHVQAVSSSHDRRPTSLLVQSVRIAIMGRFSLHLGLLSALLSTVHLAAANVEKAIFLGPAAINIPTQKPSLPDLNLRSLTPGNHSIRTELDRVFPSESPEQHIPRHATWLLLENLTEGQRYEVRVCWAATVCYSQKSPPSTATLLTLKSQTRSQQASI